MGIFNKRRNNKHSGNQVLQTLFECNYEKVYKTAYSVILDADLAKDVTQEAFLRAFAKLETLRDKSKFTSWICKIAINVANDMLKEKITRTGKNVDIYDNAGHIKEYLFVSSDINLDEICLNNEIKRELLRCIDELDPLSRRIMYLKFYEELTYEQIAAVLEMKEGTLKCRVHRAREKISNKLKAYL